MPVIDKILEDIKQSHIILNAEAGHGKSCALMTIIHELKIKNPKIIIKCFDPSQVWYWNAPLKHRQKITPENLFKVNFLNLVDCVYDVGSLNEELRRFFAALIIRQDFEVRREMGYRYGMEAVKKLPLTVFVFEEADTYFDSASLNKKDEASAILRDFIKIGRNFGLRAFCVTTAAVGELGTKFRRRSKHLIGKIISDSDYREYNRMSKNKTPKGKPRLGEVASNLKKFHWIYYNGTISKTFYIPNIVNTIPRDYTLAPKSAPLVIPEQTPFKLTPGMIAVVCLIVGALLATWFL